MSNRMFKVKTLRNLNRKQTLAVRRTVKRQGGRGRTREAGLVILFPTDGYLRPSQKWQDTLLDLGW